jgi:uncharacterized protein (DUF697 family)
MNMNEEVLASVRVLVAIAKADGKIHPNEEQAISNALEGADMPGGVTAQTLLASNVDVDDALAVIKDPELQRRTLEAACAMVYVDHDASPDEKKLLEKVRSKFNLEQPSGFIEGFKREMKQDFSPMSIDKINDAAVRDAEVEHCVRRFAIRSAILGALPFPMLGEFCVVFNESRMLSVIACIYGHPMDKTFWKAFAANLLGLGISRLAVTSLMKLVPGWGSVVGATGSFATTYGLGRAAKAYFESGEKADPALLKDVFKTAKQEGVALAKETKSDIDAAKVSFEKEKEKLDSELRTGAITEEQYADKLVKLDGG